MRKRKIYRPHLRLRTSVRLKFVFAPILFYLLYNRVYAKVVSYAKGLFDLPLEQFTEHVYFDRTRLFVRSKGFRFLANRAFDPLYPYWFFAGVTNTRYPEDYARVFWCWGKSHGFEAHEYSMISDGATHPSYLTLLHDNRGWHVCDDRIKKCYPTKEEALWRTAIKLYSNDATFEVQEYFPDRERRQHLPPEEIVGEPY